MARNIGVGPTRPPGMGRAAQRGYPALPGSACRASLCAFDQRAPTEQKFAFLIDETPDASGVEQTAVVGSIARHVKCSKGWTEFQKEKQREKEAGAQPDEDDRDQTESEHSESDDSDYENEWIRVCMDLIGGSKGGEQQKKTKAPKKPKLPTIKLLSETRWICNYVAVDSILKNYKLLLDYFAAKAGVYFHGPNPAEVNVSFDEKTDLRSGLKPAKAREFVNQLENFGHFYTLRVLSDVFFRSL